MPHIFSKSAQNLRTFWRTTPNIFILTLLSSLCSQHTSYLIKCIWRLRISNIYISKDNFPITMNVGMMLKQRGYIFKCMQHWFKFKEYFLFGVSLQLNLLTVNILFKCIWGFKCIQSLYSAIFNSTLRSSYTLISKISKKTWNAFRELTLHIGVSPPQSVRKGS